MILKIDLKKAFDRIEWSFIRQALFFFRVPPKLSSLNMSWISSSSIYILFNGERTDYFNPSIGISQGEPLSPYLFIICMELISRRIDMKLICFIKIPLPSAKKVPPFPICTLLMISSFLRKTATPLRAL